MEDRERHERASFMDPDDGLLDVRAWLRGRGWQQMVRFNLARPEPDWPANTPVRNRGAERTTGLVQWQMPQHQTP